MAVLSRPVFQGHDAPEGIKDGTPNMRCCFQRQYKGLSFGKMDVLGVSWGSSGELFGEFWVFFWMFLVDRIVSKDIFPTLGLDVPEGFCYGPAIK